MVNLNDVGSDFNASNSCRIISVLSLFTHDHQKELQLYNYVFETSIIDSESYKKNENIENENYTTQKVGGSGCNTYI
jgi:hypothetical protein